MSGCGRVHNIIIHIRNVKNFHIRPVGITWDEEINRDSQNFYRNARRINWDKDEGIQEEVHKEASEEETYEESFSEEFSEEEIQDNMAEEGGSLQRKTTEEALELIEIIANNQYMNFYERASKRGVREVETVDAILAQNKAMA
ncbi:hypothetical protein PIB30_077712 [Stylosanthes scabra]|uniref:Uncharacterized protein n=1 Tax=Stylosanthes scabra TaxID=79078 RepID=A0ABU6RQG5_9FABA|nr:hypothetical protein [Stylosanthes scabra]